MIIFNELQTLWII